MEEGTRNNRSPLFISISISLTSVCLFFQINEHAVINEAEISVDFNGHVGIYGGFLMKKESLYYKRLGTTTREKKTIFHLI